MSDLPLPLIVKFNTSIIFSDCIRDSVILTIPKLHLYPKPYSYLVKFYNCSKSDKVVSHLPLGFMSTAGRPGLLFVIFQIYELQRLHGKVSRPVNSGWNWGWGVGRKQRAWVSFIIWILVLIQLDIIITQNIYNIVHFLAVSIEQKSYTETIRSQEWLENGFYYFDKKRMRLLVLESYRKLK